MCWKHSKAYYKRLCRKADYINETFKYEGTNSRAVVLEDENGYKIVILRRVEK